MFLVGLISWWYGRGWQGQLGRVRDRLGATASFFSIGQLLATLFAPYRQISAGKTKGSLSAQVRGFFDQMLSRVVGAFIRFFTILAGIVIMLVQAVYELLIILFWLLLPAFPVIGLIIFAIGWVPRWI